MASKEWRTLVLFGGAMIGLSFISRDAALYSTIAVGIVILIRSGVLSQIGG